MSKGNMLLGHARGKVGDLVFSRTNGQQITRSRAAVVKNPQTEAQMIQRIILNTVSQAYSKMAPIVDHSFEGVQVGQKSMSYFMRKNMDQLRAVVASSNGLYNAFSFSPLGQGIYSPNPYVIAKGSLPSISPEIALDEQEGDVLATINLSGNTYAAMVADYGLQRGDQITFVGITQTSETNTIFDFCRVILDPRDSEGMEMDMNTVFAQGNAAANPSPRNEGQFGTFSFADSKLTFTFPTRGSYVACGVIVSRKNTDGSWLRSDSVLAVSSDAQENFGYSMGECIDLFLAGGVETLNSRYLNNSGTGNLLDNNGNSFSTYMLTTTGALDPSKPVTLIGVRQATVEGITCLCAYDAAGVNYPLFSNNSFSRTINHVLSAANGTQTTAWTEVPQESRATFIPKTVSAYGYGSDGEANWTEMTAWLQTQGINPNVFVNQ